MIRLCPVCVAECEVPERHRGPVACQACDAAFLADTQGPDDPLASLPSARPQRVEIAQGTDAWRALRRTLRMASETPAVLGLSSFSNALANLRDEKRGKRIFVNAAMRKGTEQEPFARAAYAEKHGAADAAMYVDGAYGCSLDGISADCRTVLEIKTPYRGRAHERWRLAVAGRTLPSDYAQIQHQLMVCRAARAHLFVWDAEAREGEKVEILPDPAFWVRIRTGWDKFWPTL
jgi:putative phage-type endonuclease